MRIGSVIGGLCSLCDRLLDVVLLQTEVSGGLVDDLLSGFAVGVVQRVLQAVFAQRSEELDEHFIG